MPFWHNDPAGDNPYASLNRTDWVGINANFSFDEVAFKDNEDFYFVYGYAIFATDVNKAGGGSSWKLEPQLVTFKIAKKDYTKQDFKTKKNIAVEQSRVEKLFCKLIESYDLNKVYVGNMTLQDGGITDMLISGNDGGGKPIAPETFASLASTYLRLEVVETPTKVVLDELKVPAKTGGYGNSKSSQSELERLNDRMNFILKQCQNATPEYELKSLMDVAAQLMYNPETTKLLQKTWECCIDLMK